MHYLISGLLLFCSISFVRFIYLYYSSKRDLEKLNQPYNIGDYIRNLRNVDFSPDQQVPSSKVRNTLKQPINKSNILPRPPVILDSFWAGANIMRQYLCMDDNFYEGISKLSNETIENFSDLSAKLKTYEHNFTGLTEGGLSKIKGHVAESYIAEHFKEAGIEVTWPETSNQEGFDLLFNGNPIQSKFIEDANNLVEHFQKYPDIPVVIPSDANNIPETAFHFDPSEGIDNLFNYLKDNPKNAVIVNHELSNVDLTESIEQGSDLATGAVDFNFPWVTAAFSSFRELKLLISDDTDIFSSIKNLGFDVAGVGIGVMTGMEVGAIAGSIVPGFGTVIGGGLGSVIGGIIGRSIANEIKQEQLKEAVKKMKKSRRKLKSEAKKIQEKYNQQFNKFKKEEQNKINCKAKESKDIVRRKVRILRRWAVNREKLSDNLKTNLLKNIIKPTKKKETSILIEYLWLDRETIKQIANQRNIKKYQKYFTQNKFKDKADLFQEFAKRGLCQKDILLEIKKSEEQRKTKESYLMNEIKKEQEVILKFRIKSMKRLTSKMEKYIEQIKRDLSPYIKDIKSCRDLVQKETKKLGRKSA